MQRIILHIDMDAFFASVEEREKPWLKDKPIVVGSDPKGGKGRGVVATANYAARKFGIHSAQPISKAWQLAEAARLRGAPRTAFVSGSGIYSTISKEILAYLKTITPLVQSGGIDEWYLEITNNKELITDNKWKFAEKTAWEIKKTIFTTQRLTASVGVGSNKLIAKIASDHQKPDGLTIVRPKNVQSFLDPKPVRAIPGIGPKMELSLHGVNIQTVRELRALSEEELHTRFGKWGLSLYRKARGISDSPVQTERDPAKSISEQQTFKEDTLNPVFLIQALRDTARRVHERATKSSLSFRAVGIMVRFQGFITKTRSHTLSSPANDLRTIEHEALQLFLPFLDARSNPDRRKIRLVGVKVEKMT
ncbi:MAG: DNA polymerase IV [Candidatus Harrisonbacteria bacterium CG10_big_fil_rev_8_21_14_0_10_42_17]|uniref:DNA polymerase IV n=1 Tax=Candidatus Harrisonbacteria bacterium CG10_big_fil_rev_8_21_14_0_10_42_17 TaxID=1974584 RepID=A0A2M6WI41_9BACT|nr:MAG: DNA polymerase IV [Candidatus Harrisonbacteria bacterium CG10_big_fil_rev_8_21_14_0_10_42_17]